MSIKAIRAEDEAVLAEMREWLDYSKTAEFQGTPNVYERKRGARNLNKLIQQHPALAKAHGLEMISHGTKF